MFSYHTEEQEQKVTIYFKGDLDIEVTEMLEEEVIPALLAYKNVEIDFHEVPFVDSTGIGLFINLVESVKSSETNCEIVVKNIQPSINEVFELVQLKDILEEKAVFL
jgi:anti-anti-sigma factor